jgi:hypothetical protein
VHISAAILFAEGSVRSKSDVHIIDHHNNKKVCFFSRARRERRCSRFEFAGFFSSFLVHISVVVLVAEGSARSNSEGEIIDHYRQNFFLFIFN